MPYAADARRDMVKTDGQRVLIADDQSNIRSSLRLLLEQRSDAYVVGEAADATGLLLLLEDGLVDTLLLDWELPGLPMHYLLHLLRHDWPDLHIVAMSSRPEARLTALQAGASAFLSKGALPEDVLAVLAGFTWPHGQPGDNPGG
jgi:DNA-binding NarL/FixJ family response regulator